MKGKIITIEGTDCSGKETQSKFLIEKLKSLGYKVTSFSFPFYSSATGKIIAGPYLAKFGECYFEEGAVNVNPYVSSLYYSADRKYNLEKIESALNENDFVVLDRFVYSNMAHQGSKFQDENEQNKFFKFIEELEFGLLNIPKPDYTLFLHMPTECAKILKAGREEKPDQHEQDENYLKHSENTYLKLKDMYNFTYISCVDGERIKTPVEISEEVFDKINNDLLLK